MFKFKFLCLFFFFSLICFSQNIVSVKGKIIDKETKLPLESATVYLTSTKDSTIIDYSITDKNGNFSIKSKKNNVAVFFKCSFIGYKDYTKKLDDLKSDLDLNFIELEEKIAQLNEVVVKGEVPPIVIKKDTLEFNASSFKVTPDANVEALLKQLPGVEIDDEGKITVNGKEVNNILVNGKPFFGKDGKIATQNLPADLIEKVQVTDTKTKSEELSGDAASSNEATINLTIDEEKNKGTFGKATAGYGSDDRYEASLLFNTFNKDQKISILGSSNNINAIGFSMDEIFDNMGGGRNMSVWYNDDGSFGINGRQFGGNNGITKTQMLGVNYNDEWAKGKVQPNGSYFYNETNTENNNRTERTNLLPQGNTFSKSDSFTKNDAFGHSLSFDFEIKLDSLSTIYYSPSLNKNGFKNKFKSNSATYDVNNNLLNTNDTDNFTDGDSEKNYQYLFWIKNFKNKRRNLSAGIENTINKNTSLLNTKNETVFLQSGSSDDIRNQNINEFSRDSDTEIYLQYTEPVLDSISLGFELNYRRNKKSSSQNTFDFNGNSYSDFNDILSNDFESIEQRFNPEVSIRLRKSKIRGSLNLGTSIIDYDASGNYLGQKTMANKHYFYPMLNGYFSYNLSKSKSVYSYYGYNVIMPTAQQLLPIQNLSNPLNTFVGNDLLKPSERYNIYFNFNNYDYPTRTGMFAYAGGEIIKNSIVSSTIYDADFKATTTYQNIDFTYNTYFGTSLSKSFKKEKRTIKYGLGFHANYNLSKGLTNAVEFQSNSLQFNPKVNFSWSIDEMITISPSYKYSYTLNDFTNYIIDKSSNFSHSLKLETTSYWPKKVVLGNDFGYNYNSNIADGFKKDFYLWNLSLGYNFMKDQLLAKVKVYDLLNQNISATRRITPTAIVDSENLVLQRYVMFSLTYKLEKFAGKKKDEGQFIIID